MSEQIEAVEVDEAANFVIEETETVETAATTETTPEEKVETPEDKLAQLESVVKEKAFKEREARREAEQLQEQLAKLKAEQPQESRPNVPDLPDPFDDDFADKVRQRDEALAKAVKFDAEQNMLQQQAQQAQQQQALQEQQLLNKRMQTYTERATALGVSSDDLRVAGQQVANYGIDDQVASFVLDHDQGPLITKYLSTSPMELDAIRQMSPMQAAVYIESSVKGKAAQLGVKKQTTAPEPVEVLNGAGAPVYDEGPAGATYE